MIMPVIVLGWLPAATYLRLTRSAMLDVLHSEYITLARAKGVSSFSVIWKHAFKNALIPPLTVSALLLASFINGSIVVETVFAWPGIGRLAIQSVWDNDFPVLTATVLLFAVFNIVLNFFADVLVGIVDPRIRYS
jgi:peptide/nickel transport system permease protein